MIPTIGHHHLVRIIAWLVNTLHGFALVKVKLGELIDVFRVVKIGPDLGLSGQRFRQRSVC